MEMEKYSDLQSWEIQEKKKAKRFIMLLFVAVWGHLSLPQKIPSDSLVQGRPETRWMHGILNQAT